MSGRATLAGAAVIRSSQYEESRGLSTGTGMMKSGRRATRANCCISSWYVSVSTPTAS